MKLKITVKEPLKAEKEVNWQDLPKGTVYKNREGVVFIRGSNLILLRNVEEEFWFEKRCLGSNEKDVPNDPWNVPAEILGQLTEIIVEKT